MIYGRAQLIFSLRKLDRALSALAIYHSRESRSKINCKDHLPDKPVAHREQAPEAIRILPAPDVGARYLRGSRSCAGCGAHFHRQVNEAGFRNRKITLDIARQSTTIWLWIDWVQHLLLYLIQPAGRWSNDSPMGLPLCMD
jgi:hypothetical protein